MVSKKNRTQDSIIYNVHNLKKLIIFVLGILITLVFSNYIYADDSEEYELLLYDERELEDIELLSYETLVDESDGVELPQKVDLSQSVHFPPITHQVGGSCASWATTYYQFTYEVAKMNNWNVKSDSTKIYSPQFIYNFANNGRDKGTYVSDNYIYLKKLGAVKMSEFNREEPSMEWYQGETYEDTVSTLRNALKTRVETCNIMEFYNCENEVVGEPVITSYNDEDLKGIKTLLNDGKTLVFVSAPLDFEIRSLENGEEICIYKNSDENNHAMTIVGYDDTIWYDLNGDGEKQDYELGALKVANSWGTGYHNEGYVWILYDALNATSNVAAYNTDTRGRLIKYNNFIYITVDNYEPELTAEITLSFCDRSELAIYTSREKYVGITTSVESMFFSGYGEEINAKGGTDYQTYTLVVDFTGANEARIDFIRDYSVNEIFDTNNYYYMLDIRDKIPSNEDKISVDKIKWVDSNGNIIKEECNLGYIGEDGKIYAHSLIPVNQISFDNTDMELYLDEEVQLNPNILPSNATKTDLTWISSNENVATVDKDGNVTYSGVGTATITATTTDGTNLAASCTVTTYDDYSDDKDRAKLINLNTSTAGEIETAYDADYFKFVAPSTGKYIFNTEGYTDTIVYVYNSSNSVIGYNDDYSEKGYYNFAVACDLTQGETYYIKVIAYDSDTGEYDLVTRKSYTNWVTCDVMQSGRHVLIEGYFASIFDQVEIQLGNSKYTIDVPDDLNDVEVMINGVEFSVNFSSSGNGYYTKWDIEAVIPETQDGVSDNIICTFSQDDLIVIMDMSEF